MEENTIEIQCSKEGFYAIREALNEVEDEYLVVGSGVRIGSSDGNQIIFTIMDVQGSGAQYNQQDRVESTDVEAGEVQA